MSNSHEALSTALQSPTFQWDLLQNTACAQELQEGLIGAEGVQIVRPLDTPPTHTQFRASCQGTSRKGHTWGSLWEGH